MITPWCSKSRDAILEQKKKKTKNYEYTGSNMGQKNKF